MRIAGVEDETSITGNRKLKASIQKKHASGEPGMASKIGCGRVVGRR
jgi:hypothetical protein